MSKEIKLPQPIGQRVIVEPVQDVEKIGSIYIPEAVREKNQEGTILALGTGKAGKPFDVKVGDKVLFSKYGGTELEVGDRKLKLVHEDDIIAIL